MHNIFKTPFLAFCISALSVNAIANTPTPAQMAQFKSLPKAQQEQLARQYGIDLNALQQTGQPSQDISSNNSQVPARPLPTKKSENRTIFLYRKKNSGTKVHTNPNCISL